MRCAISSRSAAFWLALGCSFSLVSNVWRRSAVNNQSRVESVQSSFLSLFETFLTWPRGLQATNERERLFDETEAFGREIRESAKIYCLILTSYQYQEDYAHVVMETWGRKCDGLTFVSDYEEPSIPTVQFCELLNITYYSWQCTRKAFEWVYDNNLLEKFDFFVKANDDSYFIMENLRWFLHRGAFDPDQVHYIGRDMSPHSDAWHEGVKSKKNPRHFASGKPGYVLSRQAVKKLNEIAFKKSSVCTDSELGLDLNDDVEMGRCMEAIGAKLEYTLDGYGRQRFMTSSPWNHLFTELSVNDWMWSHDRYPFTDEAMEGCSESAIAFSDVAYDSMNTLEYFINRMRTVGVRLRRPRNYTGSNGLQEESYESILALLRKNKYVV